MEAALLLFLPTSVSMPRTGWSHTPTRCFCRGGVMAPLDKGEVSMSPMLKFNTPLHYLRQWALWLVFRQHCSPRGMSPWMMTSAIRRAQPTTLTWYSPVSLDVTWTWSPITAPHEKLCCYHVLLLLAPVLGCSHLLLLPFRRNLLQTIKKRGQWSGKAHNPFDKHQTRNLTE